MRTVCNNCCNLSVVITKCHGNFARCHDARKVSVQRLVSNWLYSQALVKS